MAKLTEIDVTDEEGNYRTITPTTIKWMLFIGWTFYIASLILNHVYYKLHPSSPKMFNWGREETLEGWTPPEETQTPEEEGLLEPSILY